MHAHLHAHTHTHTRARAACDLRPQANPHNLHPQAVPQTMSTLASELSGLGHPCAGEENAESASGAGVEQQDRGDDKDGHEERQGAGTLQEAVRPCQSAGIIAGKV